MYTKEPSTAFGDLSHVIHPACHQLSDLCGYLIHTGEMKISDVKKTE